MKMSPEQIEQIRQRETKATEGPWMVFDSCSWRRIGLADQSRTIIEPTIDTHDGHPDLTGKNLFADLDFLVHARQDIPELLDHIAEVEGELESTKIRLVTAKADARIFGDSAEAAEAALRSRDEAVREARAQGMRDAAEIAEAAEDIDPEPTKELGDARARAAGQIARAIRERAAAERLEKIVEQEGKR